MGMRKGKRSTRLQPKRIKDRNGKVTTVYVKPSPPFAPRGQRPPQTPATPPAGVYTAPRSAPTPTPPAAPVSPPSTMNSSSSGVFVPGYTENNTMFDEESYLFNHTEHDYNPTWDYHIRFDQMKHPLTRLAQKKADELSALNSTSHEKAHVYPAVLNPDVLGVYCAGTYNEPVILISVDNHVTALQELVEEHGERNVHTTVEEQILKTVEHELAHAEEEADWDSEYPIVFDEEHAETRHFN